MRGRVAAVLAGTLLALACAELAARWWFETDWLAPPVRQVGAWHELLHRASSVPGLAYELVPERVAFARGALVATNADGFRDAPRIEEAKRVLALGDSVTFGFGVSSEDTYPNVLEARLRASAEGAVEVVDLGVGGYSTQDEAAQLAYWGPRLGASIVIVGYVLNDPELEPVQPLQRQFRAVRWWQRSALVRALCAARRRRQLRGYSSYEAFLHDPSGAPWRATVAALGRIAATADGLGAAKLLAIFPMVRADVWSGGWSDYPFAELHAQVAQAAGELGFLVVDLLPAYRASGRTPRELYFADRHPNALGHQIAAEALEKALPSPKPTSQSGVR